MTDVSIRVSGAKEAAASLKRYGRKIQNWGDVWEELAYQYVAAQAAWFDGKGRGSWQPLSPSYAKWKARVFPGAPLLVRTGTLRDSLVGKDAILELSEDELVLGTNVDYAAYHQYGTIHMPARPPLMPVGDFKRLLTPAVRRHLEYDE